MHRRVYCLGHQSFAVAVAGGSCVLVGGVVELMPCRLDSAQQTVAPSGGNSG